MSAELEAAAATERERTPLAGALWSAAQLDDHLRRLGLGNAWAEAVLPAMRTVAGATLRSGAERSDSQNHNAFELFGLDFMIDATGRLLLIEVNSQPALCRHGRRRWACDVRGCVGGSSECKHGVRRELCG